MKRLLLIPFFMFLLGQSECESPPPQPEPGDDPYCYGSPSVWQQVEDVGSQLWTIMGGELSTDRRVSLRVALPGGRCSGGAIGPHTYLTAGHCSWAQEWVVPIIDYDENTRSYFDSISVVEHPEYVKYRQSGNAYAAGRYYDVALGKVGWNRKETEDGFPEPYAGIFHLDNINDRASCVRMWIQGWGKHEGPELQLREGEYVIDALTPTSIRSFIDPDEASICFGDSGSLLLAEMNDGTYKAVGVTSTTDSQDCRKGSTHARLDIMEPWILEQMQ
jgi:hypothetical protein